MSPNIMVKISFYDEILLEVIAAERIEEYELKKVSPSK